MERSGRISDTIAAARQAVAQSAINGPASLLDPSRPFTPAMPRQTTPFSMMSSEESTRRHKEDWPIFHTAEDWRPGTPAPNALHTPAPNARAAAPLGGRRMPSTDLTVGRPHSGRISARAMRPGSSLSSRKSTSAGSAREKKRSSERSERSESKESSEGLPPRSARPPPGSPKGTATPPTKSRGRPPAGARKHRPRSGSASRVKRSIEKDLIAIEEKRGRGGTAAELHAECADLLRVCHQGPQMASLCKFVLELPYSESKGVCAVHTKSCEKVFSMSKDTTLDAQLAQMIELLLAVLDGGETRGFKQVSFVLGAIRNLSLEDANSESIVEGGGIARLSRLLDEKVYLALTAAEPPEEETSSKLLVEVCGVLRNLAIVKNKQKLFIKGNCLRRLCLLMGPFSDHPQMMLNACRILSKLSLNKACRDLISDPQHLRAMVQMLHKHNTKLALCIRICFTLGNLTVSNDRNRTEISDKCDGVTVLLELLAKNCERDTRISGYKKKKANDPKRAESKEYQKAIAMDKEICDMLIKLIRVIANLAINRRIGSMFSKEPAIASLVHLLQSKNMREHEELVLNIISAITNLSFYHQISAVGGRGEGRLPLVDHNKDILACLIPHLFSQNNEVVVESVRALGNFSREASFRGYMRESRVDETLVVLLDHSDPKVVYGVCGVLLNIAADPSGHGVFFSDDGAGVDRVLSVLTRFGLEDYGMTDVVCKAFLNLLAASAGHFPPAHRKRLQHLLAQIQKHLEREHTELKAEVAEVNATDGSNHSPSGDHDGSGNFDAQGALEENESLYQVLMRLVEVAQPAMSTRSQ